MQKRMFLVWIALGVVNLSFAISGRGQLYYLVAALFFGAGVMAYIGQRKQTKS